MISSNSEREKLRFPKNIVSEYTENDLIACSTLCAAAWRMLVHLHGVVMELGVCFPSVMSTTKGLVLHSVRPNRSASFQCAPHVWLTDSSTGVGRRLLKRAVWWSVEGRSTGGQHVASAFLGDSLSRWLGGRLRGLLRLVFLRRGRVGSWPSLRDQLGSSRWLEAAVMLEERRREERRGEAHKMVFKWCWNLFFYVLFRIGLLLNCCVGVFSLFVIKTQLNCIL